jgi:nucleoside-diphosphate-sugar epimerase
MPASHVVLGTGAIGRAIADELVSRGEQLRMVNRSGRLSEVPNGVEVLAADLYDPAQVREVTRAATVVYHCAQPNYYEWPEKFPPLQSSILDGLAGNGCKLVIAENLYMYGVTGGQPMTEALPHNAHTRKGRTRSAISQAALAAHQAGKVRVTIGRGSDFFGPWGLSSTMGERAFYPLLQGKAAQLTGRLDVPHTHTFTKDFGKALVILGGRSEADGQAWHVPNDMPRITQGELVQMFAQEAGVAAKTSGIGKLGLTAAGLFIPEAKESVEMLYEFEQPFIVDSTKFEKTFGVQATPMRDAMCQTVAWYKAHPRTSGK